MSHFDKIVDIIYSSSLEPHLLADQLYSARLIDDNAMEEASEAGMERVVRIKRLMSAVQTQVERDPSNYYSFVKLAEDLPEVKNVLVIQILFSNKNENNTVIPKYKLRFGFLPQASDNQTVVHK